MLYVLYFWLGLDLGLGLGLVDVALASFTYGLVNIPSLPALYYRPNDSSGPVLTATSHSYGNGHNSTPHKIQTP